MNRLVIVSLVLASAFAASAESKAVAAGSVSVAKPAVFKLDHLTPAERQAKIVESVNQRAGGFVDRPGSRKGEIFYVNCQKKAPRAWIEESMGYFASMTRFTIGYKEGSFDLKGPKVEGNVTLFVVDDEALPPILVAPENSWAFVNVAPIAQEKRPAFFEARVKKELSRAFAYLCGATGSRFQRSLTRGIVKQADLDQNPDYSVPMDVVQRFRDYMAPLGVTPGQRVTYMKACQEGWAAQPTNDVQKAIWKKVHELPTAPIKIAPEARKVRD